MNRYIVRDGFSFTAITPPWNVCDAIIIKHPINAQSVSFATHASSPNIEEVIEFINEERIEKALIIAESIDFITLCPTLKHLRITPADSAKNEFDYSPLYKMPKIKSLHCENACGTKNNISAYIDCSKIKGLEDIHISSAEYKNYNSIKTLKGLGLSNYSEGDLSNAFNSEILDTLSVFQSKIKSLNGIQKSYKMQCLYLHYNRLLSDISALKTIKTTLKTLRIENCPSIDDFSVLGELESLELLELSGNNELPNLNFLKTMKNLKTFVFNVNIKDGDLSQCLKLSYAFSEKNRKHYNLKDSDLPKGQYIRGNETIEEWRRLE